MNLNYPDILQKAGIRPSVQRVAVYKYLCMNPVHPDVETVYADLAPDYPTLSRTTVYNTLKLFEEKNIVQSLKIEDDKLRFDAEMRDHMHFKCTSCGTISDIFTNKSVNLKDICISFLPSGFKLNKFQSTVWGLCKNCNK